MRFATGLGACSLGKIILNYVIWCILVNILIRSDPSQISFFAYYKGPPQIICLHTTTTCIWDPLKSVSLYTIYPGHLRSALSLTIYGPSDQFFTYYMEPPSGWFLCLLYEAPSGQFLCLL